MLHYEPGQRFDTHYDFIAPHLPPAAAGTRLIAEMQAGATSRCAPRNAGSAPGIALAYRLPPRGRAADRATKEIYNERRA